MYFVYVFVFLIWGWTVYLKHIMANPRFTFIQLTAKKLIFAFRTFQCLFTFFDCKVLRIVVLIYRFSWWLQFSVVNLFNFINTFFWLYAACQCFHKITSLFTFQEGIFHEWTYFLEWCITLWPAQSSVPIYWFLANNYLNKVVWNKEILLLVFTAIFSWKFLFWIKVSRNIKHFFLKNTYT